MTHPALPRYRDPSGSRSDDEIHEVETIVFALIPEFEHAKVRDIEGHVYALTRKLLRINLDTLREGQRTVCTVTRKPPKVLSAEAVA